MIAKLKLLTVLLLVTTSVFSQRTIIVRITDAETQKPLENVNVKIADSDLTTFSNRIGFLQLEIKPAKHKLLMVSHIGYGSVMVPIPAQDKFQITLQKEFIMLKPVNLLRYPKASGPDLQDEIFMKKEGDIVIESEAIFVGGIKRFYDYMGNALVAIPGIKEKEFNVAFTINDQGRGVDLIFPDSAGLIKDSVTKVFDSMVAWKPATQRGKNVSQHFVLPVINRKHVDIDADEFMQLGRWYQRNLRYPAQARRMGIEGTVYVEFQIDANGSVSNINVLQQIDVSTTAEVERAIALLPKDVTRSIADQFGETKFVQPIVFGLGEQQPMKPFRGTSDGIMLKAVDLVAIGIERERSVR